MKKILLILALLCVSLHAQTYQFESATTASGGITTVTAREKTGWTSNGTTTAQDTLVPIYLLDKANIRFMVVDADGDTLWFWPQNYNVFQYKDGSTVLAGIDSAGRIFASSSLGTSSSANHANTAVSASGHIFASDGFYTNNIYGVRHKGYGTGYDFYSTGYLWLHAGQMSLTNTGASKHHGIVTIFTNGTSDTTFAVRNDKNATLDSTMMVFANGDGYFGGNNLYIGGHRIRSNAAGDSLIFYDGTTMIFAILSDGSTADLVAGVPPLRRYIPPPDVIWLLRIGILLLLLLVAFKIHDYLKPVIRKHKTLPGEI